MGFKIAIAGATGNVGREMLNILEERGFPVDEVVALASRRSVGTEVSYGDRTLKVKDLATYDFSDTDICLMSAVATSPRNGRRRSAGRAASSSIIRLPGATTRMCRSSCGSEPGRDRRLHKEEHHRQSELLDRAARRRAEAAARPGEDPPRRGLDLPVGLRAGKEGMDELFEQTRAVFVAEPISNKKFTKRIAFNVIPISTSSWKTARPRRNGR